VRFTELPFQSTASDTLHESTGSNPLSPIADEPYPEGEEVTTLTKPLEITTSPTSPPKEEIKAYVSEESEEKELPLARAMVNQLRRLSYSSSTSDGPPGPGYHRERRHSIGSVGSMGSMGSMASRLSISELGAPSKAQWVLGGTAAGAAIWVICAGSIIMVATQTYGCSGVNEARERYAVAAAIRVGTYATAVLKAAISAREAAEYAIQQKLYFEPMDYDAARATVEALLNAAPQLRAVDLAFVGRNESLTVKRMPDGQLVVMSDDADCFQRLGPLGCSSAKPSRFRPWFQNGLELSGSEDAGGGGDSTSDAPSFQWVSSPGFMPATFSASAMSENASSSTEPRYNVLDWVPAYSLVFRSVFPGTAGALSLLGRVTLDVSGIRENDQLLDSMLGPQGALYVSDRSGLLLAAADPGETVLVISPGGSVRFRHVWELDPPWAKQTQVTDFAGTERRFIHGGIQVVIAPLREPGLEHFSVVVAASREPFVDGDMMDSSMFGEVLAGMPYAALLLVVFLWFFARCVVRCRERRSRKRVHPMPMGLTGSLTGSLLGSSRSDSTGGSY
jgi:hypothetical protein